MGRVFGTDRSGANPGREDDGRMGTSSLEHGTGRIDFTTSVRRIEKKSTRERRKREETGFGTLGLPFFPFPHRFPSWPLRPLGASSSQLEVKLLQRRSVWGSRTQRWTCAQKT